MEYLDAEPRQRGPTARQDEAPATADDVVAVVAEERRTRVVLTGTIDATVKDVLADALEGAARRGLPVEVDCSAVRFIDSTGLTTLVWLANFTPEPPRLTGVPPMMDELLRLTGMDSGFDVHR